MIWFANLDPSNLRLNIDITQISRGSSKEEITNAVYSCCFGDIKKFKNILTSIEKNEDKERCVNLCSSIWHEQRHFLDLVLSNYGGYIFREYFTCYINTGNILSELLELKEDLIFPLDVYTDPVRLKLINKSTKSSKVKKIAEDLQEREKAIMKDRVKIQNLEVGAYAVFELIGFVFQLASVEIIAGHQYNLPFNNFIDKNNYSKEKYKWITIFDEILNFVPSTDINKKYQLKHIGFLPLILYPVLLSRSWRNDIFDDKKRKKFLSPASRLSLIFQYIKKYKYKFQSLEFQEIWNETNIMAQHLFGRTIIEEVEADLFFQKQMKKKLSKFKENSLFIDILSEYITLKTNIVQILRSTPEIIFNPDDYTNKILHKIRPIPVLYTPTAKDNNVLSSMGWKSLCALYEKVDKNTVNTYNFTSIPKKWKVNNLIGFKNIDKWEKIFLLYNPIAKLMIKGRNHNSVLGAEFLTVEQIIQQEINIIFEPEFEYPTNLVTTANYFYSMQNIDESICDMCGKKLTRPSGYLVSPWIFQKIQYYVLLGGNTETMYLKQAKDWSAWLVCDMCYNKLRNQCMLLT